MHIIERRCARLLLAAAKCGSKYCSRYSVRSMICIRAARPGRISSA
jgi:hypothetical protein